MEIHGYSYKSNTTLNYMSISKNACTIFIIIETFLKLNKQFLDYINVFLIYEHKSDFLVGMNIFLWILLYRTCFCACVRLQTNSYASLKYNLK